MFVERGLKEVEAFIEASKLKYGPSSQLFSSEKQMTSKMNHAWLDRVFRECAILEIGGHGKEESELFKMTSHASLLDKIKKDDDSIRNLADEVRNERSSGFLTCKNCRGSKVDVDQIQTRSADEPMTLFALCQDCGSRWTMK